VAKEGRSISLRVVDSLAGVPADAWNALAGPDPFTRHEFLCALIETGCASGRSGWRPQILLLEAGKTLRGAMPLFLKSHSYGEYVFDWAWADAYERHGLQYYPKLLCAIPFTPVTGPRLIAQAGNEGDAVREALVAGALEMAREYSSLHVLFPTEGEARLLQQAGMMMRRTVQFHWTNRAGDGYADFDDFLSGLNAHRRKVIRQERRRVTEAGVSYRWLRGAEIEQKDWAFFERCYRRTYALHRSTPYLNLDFFLRLGATLPENTVMFVAEREGKPVAATLNLRSGDKLFGRYWGAVGHIPLLHFELCYYQAIEYAIANRLRFFEGGAQGEHKLFRGLLPVETHSAHWLAHPSFASAIEDYLARERAGIARYVNELNEHSPFKDEAGASPPESPPR
jgi:uncharacterized protein